MTTSDGQKKHAEWHLVEISDYVFDENPVDSKKFKIRNTDLEKKPRLDQWFRSHGFKLMAGLFIVEFKKKPRQGHHKKILFKLFVIWKSFKSFIYENNLIYFFRYQPPVKCSTTYQSWTRNTYFPSTTILPHHRPFFSINWWPPFEVRNLYGLPLLILHLSNPLNFTLSQLP